MVRAVFVVLISLMGVIGCARTPQRATDAPTPAADTAPTGAIAPDSPLAEPALDEDFDPDPFEAYNRQIYRFNSAIDRAVVKPVAKAYAKNIPDGIQRGIGNFFRNLSEPTVIVNDVLQGKFKQSLQDTARFLINSTVGLLGFMDIAKRWGLPKHAEDFGQTLAVWGAKESPYFVMPFFGPRTVRDSVGLVADWYTDPVTYIDDQWTRYGTRAVGLMDTRAQLLTASKVLEQATDDEYLFVREAYLQKRQQLIYDGNVPAPPSPAFP